MSADTNVRYLPTAAAQKMAELQQRLETATEAAKVNAEAIDNQRRHIHELERQIALLSEHSTIVKVIRENATDLLTGALEAIDYIRVRVKAKRYVCSVLGHRAASPSYCHEQKPRLQVMEEVWSLRDAIGDLECMPARDQATLLVAYAFGERVIVTKCGECNERNSDCRCGDD